MTTQSIQPAPFLAQGSGGVWYCIAPDLTTAVAVQNPIDVEYLAENGLQQLLVSAALVDSLPSRS